MFRSIVGVGKAGVDAVTEGSTAFPKGVFDRSKDDEAVTRLCPAAVGPCPVEPEPRGVVPKCYR